MQHGGSTEDGAAPGPPPARRGRAARIGLPVTVHRARLGPVEYRVVRPARPLPRAVLLDRDRFVDGHLDRTAARAFAALWLLAARSPRTLVHLPIRGNDLPPDVPAGDGRRLDLVLLHHRLQFAPSRWKELRGRLGAGLPQQVDLPRAAVVDGDRVDHAARHHRENRDLFRQHLHAETLFMTGSAKVFGETAGKFLDLAVEGPAHVSAHPAGPHFCTEFHAREGVLGTARELHIEYREAWGTPADAPG
ncbi:hypothetical protein [Kitasatospora sp. NPDC088346]|uniref:hypothetical protein n=1 Tax=Kitasatospora sp. NPDC088346 TaxID=3364073 RepID=UPI00382BB379